ncbi:MULTISPECIES: DUF1127 domain-containing protein [unclassified Meridianimarinicoccus]|uniref:DUF1127 domain-containing protein n=1 Tax=unclassified Meridianimarinicoccus TaxID=2923344 RepID=UPI001865C089|nr:DUF1127 domain-containing protein [Fluviibacterium sp. MJW13]
MAFTADIRTYENSIVNRIERALDAFRAHRTRRATYRVTINELSVLSDRDLNDLGLSRSDIPAVAREAAGMK